MSDTQSSSGQEKTDFPPFSTEWRESLLARHPVVTRKFILATNPISQAHAVARERFFLRSSGALFYGFPRLGKTYCTFAIRAAISAEFPTEVVVLMTARKVQESQSSHVYYDILYASHAQITRMRYRDEEIYHLLSHVRCELAQRGGSQVLLIVDEIQLLTRSGLTNLAVLQNMLQHIEITVTTLAFAQAEILARRDALFAEKQHHLLARFMSDPISFPGCASANDLSVMLEDYDEHKKFPDNIDCSFTQFFFPQAYEHGFRLARYANELFSSMIQVAAPLNLGAIPMEHTCATIAFLLTAYRKLDGPDFVFEDQHFRAAVGKSHLAEYCSALALPSTGTPP